MLTVDDIIDLAETVEPNAIQPLIQRYWIEYERTMLHGLPKEYYLGYLKMEYQKMQGEQ
jgi:hypothetical protein